MSEIEIIQLVREALFVTLKISAPMLIMSMIVGLVISIFQTTTSIQEQTLTFVPKLVAVFIAIAVSFSYILNTGRDYAIGIFNLIVRF